VLLPNNMSYKETGKTCNENMFLNKAICWEQW